ncbi:WXG100 family type VII secretion target [Micromonospora sp. NPDC004551]|uniref:WXG100 family type VII secretion target n=1 Tax=Micromonospora sp. NPDC004551 TaxID=3154284 RepID=UPI0033B79990
MTDVNVGYDGLQRAAAQLKTGQTDMTQQLRALKSMIDRLTESEFRTRLASGRFRDSYQQWSTGAQNMIDGLEGMSTFLNEAVRQYQDLDNNLAGGLG